MPTTRSGSRRLALGLIGLGAVILVFGLVVEAPPGTAAVWQGVLDSAKRVPLAASSALVPSAGTSGVSLFFRNGPGSRTLSLPREYADLAGSLEPHDTLRVMLGWEWQQETPLALEIVRNGAVLLDSAAVLRLERQRSTRITVAGTLVVLAGMLLLARRPRGVASPHPTKAEDSGASKPNGT